MKTIIFIFFMTISICSCIQNVKEPTGIDLANMDMKVAPAKDFYRYVNGGWIDRTQIPKDRSSWGGFDELRKATDKDVMNIMKEAVNNASLVADSDQTKAVSIYKSVMDTISRNTLGIKPLDLYLKKIDNSLTIKDLEQIFIEIDSYVDIGFLNVYVYADAEDSNKNVVYLSTSSLGLSDKEYYVSDTPDNKEKRSLYVAHIARMFHKYLNMTDKQAIIQAKTILNIEIQLAESMLDRVQLRDDRMTYNPMPLVKAKKLLPSIDIDHYLREIGLPILDSVVVTQPKYISTLQQMIKNRPVSDWKAYMRWNLLRRTAKYLSTDIENTNWEFYSKTLRGTPEQRPLDERALIVVNSTVKESLGRLYVEKKFPSEAKTKVEKMVSYLFKSYKNRIENLSWMSDETKSNALKKLSKIRVKIGYPNKWKDYSALHLKSPDDGGTYFDNMMQYRLWSHQDNISKYGKPVDKEEWGMSPQTVNAYYSPSKNEIVFPAAILQPPFYNYKADEAINFGGIGAIIGHEISHSFDDSGSRYDADGNLNNWWTDSDLDKFSLLGTALAEQYSAIKPLPGISIDGKFTLGENIGDLGGINAAFEGLILYLKDHGNPGLIDKFTPQQRFFISWTTIWRTKMRDEAIKRRLKTDPHSPGMYRAYVPLQNVDAFYEAFDIKDTDTMYISPDKRVKIW